MPPCATDFNCAQAARKSEFRLSRHSVLPARSMVELVHHLRYVQVIDDYSAADWPMASHRHEGQLQCSGGLEIPLRITDRDDMAKVSDAIRRFRPRNGQPYQG